MELMDSTSDEPIPLPVHISKPDHQLSGHEFGKSKTRFGMLKDHRSKRLLKPIIDIRGKREYDFYQTVWNSSDVKLQSFVPKFYGLVTIENIKFIQIEDSMEGLANPSNMDIKIGSITYDPGADVKKIEEETSKSQWQAALGFRICGFRIYNPMDQNCTLVDKFVTRQLKPENIPEAIDMFLGSQFNSLEIRIKLSQNYLSKLKSIQEWFETVNINHLKFLSSSLLFIHPCDNQFVHLKMIDFAHVFPNASTNQGDNCKDDNYLFGLNKIIYYFTTLHESLIQKQNTSQIAV